MEIQCIWKGRTVLGEGPLWDQVEQALFWVDIKMRTIYRLDPSSGAVQTWSMPGQIGCMALDDDGNFIAALQHGIFRVARSDGSCEFLVDPEPEFPANRFNDGKVDPHGRFWAGTLPDNEVWEPTGGLYVLDKEGICKTRLSGLRCSNGLGWSPDGRTMYVTDSMVGTIWAFDFDGAGAAISAQRVFAKWPMSEGVPDGLAVDEDGHVWTAVWDGAAIRRYAPSGTLVQTIPMPVKRPTSCVFGGAGLDTMFVTSASIGMGAQGGLDGAVFAFRPGVKGQPIPRCGIRPAHRSA